MRIRATHKISSLELLNINFNRVEFVGVERYKLFQGMVNTVWAHNLIQIERTENMEGILFEANFHAYSHAEIKEVLTDLKSLHPYVSDELKPTLNKIYKALYGDID